MTERERWIVYPLLFLALGAALRDKLLHLTTAKSIVCQELSIVDEEAPGQQSQRTLARIGTAKPISGGPSVGYFKINGDVEVVNEDVTDTSTAPVVVKLGRLNLPPNVPPAGYAIVKGEVVVDGIVNARQYVYQGIPFVPLQIVPGVPMPNVLQAMPHPGPNAPNPNAPNTKAPAQPPANEPKKDRDDAQPSTPADEGEAPAK